MSRLLQPSVPLVTLVTTKPPTVIKNEPPEEALEKEISPDIKNIDILYHSLSEDLLKSEIVPENILETKYFKSVETQVMVKTEDTSDENVSRDPNQEVIEVQASNEHSNALNNLEIDEQSVLNFSTDLNSISVRSRKAKGPKKTDFAECYKTDDSTLWEKEKEKIKVIKAPVIPVEAHEYTSLAKGKHVCNHCQHACNILSNLKKHIDKIHREVTTMYQCPNCPYKSKWKHLIKQHIIRKHKDTKDIQWFQCNLCKVKFKLEGDLTRHMNIHLGYKQMKDGLDLCEKRHNCDKCNYITCRLDSLKKHKLVHLKPEEIEYFYCYHCSNKCKRKFDLKKHIFRQHFKNVKQVKRYGCNKCNYKTYTSTKLKMHKSTHLKPEEIRYFYCYHCCYKCHRKDSLKTHIFRHHFKNVIQGKRYGCNECSYKTYLSTNLKSHKLNHLKPEEIQYFYCYHCSYKAKRKETLKKHIFRHYKKEQVKFDCYICNFMTPKRESIIKHIKKHSKVQKKSEINEAN